ncbi:hypothetical protein PNOK_0011300 [Pyrrhoderma noxium]|uniref:Zn(2)-C6 fungal-type domain-containing protein n=1 Tax=Pyrrhoderma noxium TaxID=2282107 RepID=A0A286UTY4_9AGAM|nr:hypothetical protein PNOK_0010800 [Pyrrhoderma noxium]PAV23046.1 hypothetical protein PNOK_0011300 [Pyrrhoderma noxium]
MNTKVNPMNMTKYTRERMESTGGQVKRLAACQACHGDHHQCKRSSENERCEYCTLKELPCVPKIPSCTNCDASGSSCKRFDIQDSCKRCSNESLTCTTVIPK